VDPASPSVPGLSTEISAALASLSVAQREALLIIEVLGFTYREAAEITGVAEGTFKSRVHHSRVHLHEWLRAEGRADEL
jgi:RNA polymerase sigma-70 factor (ECF subfamily)